MTPIHMAGLRRGEALGAIFDAESEKFANCLQNDGPRSSPNLLVHEELDGTTQTLTNT